MTVLSSADTAEQPPRKKLCLSASRQLQSKSYARSQLNPMASPLDQPVDIKVLIMESEFEIRIMWFLLGYSFLMFTFPFIGFFSMKYFLGQILNIQGYKVVVISVIFAVIIVQLIIYSYVKQAFNEPVDVVENDCHEEEKVSDDEKKDK